MTTEEKEELKSRINRADEIEHDLENVKELIWNLNNIQAERSKGTDNIARTTWFGIKTLSDQCRAEIAEVIKKYVAELNEEYKKL